MNPQQGMLPVNRFVKTLDMVWREGGHLSYSWRRLFSAPVDATWVRGLANAPEQAERLDAFVSGFGRMQDTIADKLLPRWLEALAESPGSQIDTLNRAERLGAVTSVRDWLEARKLRNRLVHEFMEDAEFFADSLVLARGYTLMLMHTYNSLRDYAFQVMGLDEPTLPPVLELPVQIDAPLTTPHSPRPTLR